MIEELQENEVKEIDESGADAVNVNQSEITEDPPRSGGGTGLPAGEK